MKKYFLSLLFFSSLFSAAQNPLVNKWDKRFGGTGYDMFYSVQQTTDGGYLLGGHSGSGISGDKTQPLWAGTNDYWIVKIDSVGNKQWDKDFGGTGNDWLYDVIQTSDGGYMLGGLSYSDSSGDKTQPRIGYNDYWIVKIDSLGNKQWDRDYGGTGTDWFRSIRQTSDGGYILGGFSESGVGGDKTQASQGNGDIWIVKIDSLGNKMWDKDFGGTDYDALYSLCQTPDGGYLLGGSSYSGMNGDKSFPNWDISGSTMDFWIIKTDALGNKQWDKVFGGTDDDDLASVVAANDGGFVLGGLSLSGISGDKTQSTWFGSEDYWIVKIDSMGNKLWDKDFGGTDDEFFFGNVSQTIDHGYLLAGASSSNIGGDKTENNLGPDQIWIVKTDSAGNKEWDKTAMANGTIEASTAIQTRDGCYVLANDNDGNIGGDKTQPSWNNTSDYWIVKFCDTTYATSTELLEKNQIGISIFPNPTSGQLTVNCLQFPITQIEIFDLLGNKTYSSATNCESCIVHSESFPPGIYFVKVTSREKTSFGKIIKE